MLMVRKFAQAEQGEDGTQTIRIPPPPLSTVYTECRYFLRMVVLQNSVSDSLPTSETSFRAMI